MSRSVALAAVVICLSLSLVTGPALAAGPADGIDLTKIQDVRVLGQDAGARSLVTSAADIVARQFFANLRERRLRTVHEAPETWAHTVAVGRQAAVASGLIAQKELDALDIDGYIVRGKGSTVAIAGRRPLGTYWAALAFLRHAGARAYPTDRMGWHWEYERADVLEPFSLTAPRPYFRTRFGNHLSRGLYRSKYLDTGAPREADPELSKGDAIWSDHTAAYLVPKELYMAEHPEYFAEIRGKRLGAKTRHHRLTICVSNPNVQQISARRAVEWMDKQAERRFFAITDGDARRCQCGQCIAMDYVPNYYTDRNLRWVNHVARAVAAKYPHKLCTTHAYIETQKPPVATKPEQNVVVFYCPWYWMVRCADKGPWDAHNVIEMEEMVGWMLAVPRRNLGRHNYTSGLDTDSRILKWQAKNDLRHWGSYHGDNPRGLYAFVMARLCVDPFLDRGRLEEEYCRAVFGPAAEPMLQAIRRYLHARRTHRWFQYHAPAAELIGYYREMSAYTDRALRAAADDPRVKATILADWLVSWQDSMVGSLKKHVSAGALRPAVERYLAFYTDFYASLPEKHWIRSHWTKNLQKNYQDLQKKLAGWGFALAPPKDPAAPMADLVARLRRAEGAAPAADEAKDNGDDLLLPERRLDPADLERLTAPEKPVEPRTERVALDSADVLKWFEVDQTDSAAAVPGPRVEKVRIAPGVQRPGVVIDLPFGKLPTQDLPLHAGGLTEAHTGFFYVNCRLPKPVPVRGLNSFEIHLWASTAMYLDFLLDVGPQKDRPRNFPPKVSVQVRVQPGEQIVRLDLNNLVRGGWDWKPYAQELRGLEIVAHPQDNWYPHAPARDGRLALFSVAARNYMPDATELSGGGKAIWLSQYRPNHRFAQQELAGDLYSPPQRYGLTRPSFKDRNFPSGRSEAFRTSTDRRIAAPLYGIVAADADQPQAEILQSYLQKMFRVRLPINPAGLVAKPDQGNAIFIGREAVLNAGRVSEAELKELAGEHGFMLRAKDGAVAVAGNNPAGTAQGIVRYLEAQGVRFFSPGRVEVVPERRGGFLEETVCFDRPWFAEAAGTGYWKLKGCLPLPNGRESLRSDPAEVHKLAERIKDLARAGRPVTDDVRAAAQASALARYVAAELLWNPFANTTYLVSDFLAALP